MVGSQQELVQFSCVLIKSEVDLIPEVVKVLSTTISTNYNWDSMAVCVHQERPKDGRVILNMSKDKKKSDHNITGKFHRCFDNVCQHGSTTTDILGQIKMCTLPRMAMTDYLLMEEEDADEEEMEGRDPTWLQRIVSEEMFYPSWFDRIREGSVINYGDFPYCQETSYCRESSITMYGINRKVTTTNELNHPSMPKFSAPLWPSDQNEQFNEATNVLDPGYHQASRFDLVPPYEPQVSGGFQRKQIPTVKNSFDMELPRPSYRPPDLEPPPPPCQPPKKPPFKKPFDAEPFDKPKVHLTELKEKVMNLKEVRTLKLFQKTMKETADSDLRSDAPRPPLRSESESSRRTFVRPGPEERPERSLLMDCKQPPKEADQTSDLVRSASEQVLSSKAGSNMYFDACAVRDWLMEHSLRKDMQSKKKKNDVSIYTLAKTEKKEKHLKEAPKPFDAQTSTGIISEVRKKDVNVETEKDDPLFPDIKKLLRKAELLSNKGTPKNDERLTGLALKNEEKITGLSSKHDDRISGLTSKHDEKLTGMSSKRDERITGMTSKYDERITGLSSKQDEKISGLTSKYDEKITGLSSKLEERLTGLTSQRERLTGLTSKHDERLTVLSSKHGERLTGGLIAKHGEKLTLKHEDRLTPKHEDKLTAKHEERQIVKHEERLAAKFEERMGAKHEERLAAKHEERLAAKHEEKLVAKHEERLATKHEERLTAKHDERLALKHDERLASLTPNLEDFKAKPTGLLMEPTPSEIKASKSLKDSLKKNLFRIEFKGNSFNPFAAFNNLGKDSKKKTIEQPRISQTDIKLKDTTEEIKDQDIKKDIVLIKHRKKKKSIHSSSSEKVGEMRKHRTERRRKEKPEIKIINAHTDERPVISVVPDPVESLFLKTREKQIEENLGIKNESKMDKFRLLSKQFRESVRSKEERKKEKKEEKRRRRHEAPREAGGEDMAGEKQKGREEEKRVEEREEDGARRTSPEPASEQILSITIDRDKRPDKERKRDVPVKKKKHKKTDKENE